MKNILWHDGAWIDDTKRVFRIDSRLRYGDGVFDTMLIHDAKPVFIEAHFDRLKRHAEILRLHVNMTFDEYQILVQNIIAKDNIATSGQYALNTWAIRGTSAKGLAPAQDLDAQITLRIAKVIQPFQDIHAHIATTVKRNEGSPLSQIKSCNYADNILALIEAGEHGCNEAIMMNNAGHVTCTTIGNIFCEIDEKLITPPLSDGAMDGITRSIIIKRYAAIEKSISQDMIENAQSVFMTNSIRGIVRIKTLNGRKLNGLSLKIDKNFHVSS